MSRCLYLQVEELKMSDERDKHAVHGNVSLVSHLTAVTAILASNTTYVPEQTVVFDHSTASEGHRSDASTGRCKAPVMGLYFFSLTVFSGSSQPLHVFIMKDKEEIRNVYSEYTDNSLAVTVVSVMDKGQVVYVKGYPNYKETVLGNYWPTFTGLMLNSYDWVKYMYDKILVHTF